MKTLFSSPLRVYLVLSILAALGVWAGLSLPISLFPKNAQPYVNVNASYGSLSAIEFRRLYGERIETELKAIKGRMAEVQSVEANYAATNFSAKVVYTWESDPEAAMREAQVIINAIAATLPEETRRSMGVSIQGVDSFFAMSFYSEKRSPDELYELLDPLLEQPIKRIKDIGFSQLLKPIAEEVAVELKPTVMTSLGLTPGYIENAISQALSSQNGGALSGSRGSQAIRLERMAATVDELKQVAVPLPSGRTLSLSDVANVNIVRNSENQQSFKTSGASSLILFAVPRQGGNVKRMSEEILATVADLKASLPADVTSRDLIDPSTFIRSAVANVLHEVLLGSILASLVLFIFIGNLRNVITTAIEIPISIALAFIMMWLFDMNLNLLSLAGLALASGMNVDASVVVMENIFRHLEINRQRPDPWTKLDVVIAAVREVRLSVVASTLASLVVFAPFMFVSGISYAILGDLAKAVIFSHGFSALIALILVPTVRLQLLNNEKGNAEHHAPAEKFLKRLEKFYGTSLYLLLNRSRYTWGLLLLTCVALITLVFTVLPRLPRELIGKPESDFVVLVINQAENTRKRQMESTVEQVHKSELAALASDVEYSFDQINDATSATLILKVHDRSRVPALLKKLRETFINTPTVQYFVTEWNPSEFKIPNPPEVRVVVSGSNAEERMIAGRDLKSLIDSEKIYEEVTSIPADQHNSTLVMRPKNAQWNLLREQGFYTTPSELTETLRIATLGKWLGEMMIRISKVPIMMRYPDYQMASKEELEAFPIAVKGQLIPLKALMQVDEIDAQQSLHVENGQEINVITARLKEDFRSDQAAHLKEIQHKIDQWQEKRLPELDLDSIAVRLEEPDADIARSVRQLQYAFGFSMLLIFITMLLQFGNVIEAALVMVAVPLGLIGAIASLSIFQSTLSINAVLGMILLNGIAVNNSILLVDFARRLHASGVAPLEACIQASLQRLRPILITSLTTVLGMLPIACGFGEGGRILQPLGLSVVGGLGVSMTLTLLLVPGLQALAMAAADRRRLRMNRGREASALAAPQTLAPVILLLIIGGAFIGPRLQADEALFYQTIDQLRAHDPKLKKNLENVSADREALRPLRGSWLPTFSLEASRRYERLLDDPNRDTLRSSSLSGITQLNLYGFGRDQAQSALATVGEAKQDIVQIGQILDAEDAAARRVLRVIAARFDTQILQKIRAQRQRLLDASQRQFQKGLLAQQELQKIELDLNTVDVNIRAADLERQKAEADLASYQTSVAIETAWPLRELMLSEPEKIPTLAALNANPQTLAAQSPSVITARYERDETVKRKDFLWADQMPRFDLQGQVGRTLEGQGVGQNMGSLSLVFTMPLADRYQTSSAYRAQLHRQSAAEFSLVDVERETQQAVLEDWKAYQLDRASILTREELLVKAKALYEDGVARFERGLITVNELSGDEDRFFNAERDVARSWLALHENLVSLCHRIGRPLRQCLARG